MNVCSSTGKYGYYVLGTDQCSNPVSVLLRRGEEEATLWHILGWGLSLVNQGHVPQWSVWSRQEHNVVPGPEDHNTSCLRTENHRVPQNEICNADGALCRD
jgi:hypothetical protein